MRQRTNAPASFSRLLGARLAARPRLQDFLPEDNLLPAWSMNSVEFHIICFEIILLLFKVNTNKHKNKNNKKRTAIIKQSKAKQEKD